MSTANDGHFSIVIESDLDWRSVHVIYVLTCSEQAWGMQYVEQTKRVLKTRLNTKLKHLLE